LVAERSAAQHDDVTGRQLGWLVPISVAVALGALVLTALVVTAVVRRVRSGGPS